MAATYGRLTGKPGVCITTLGPGALNLTTGAAYALLGAMPMIMLTGQKGIMSSRQAKFQIVDVVSAFKPLDEALASNRQHKQHSNLSARRLSHRNGRAAGPRFARVARRRGRRRSGKHRDGGAAPDRNPGRASCLAGSCGRNDPQSEAAVNHAWGRRVSAAEHGGDRRVCPPHTNSILHDADG